MKATVLSLLLICSLLASVSYVQSASSTISLELFSGSNQYWVAVAVRNANVDTRSITLIDASSATGSMVANKDWGFWSMSSISGKTFKFPLSFVLTSIDGATVSIDNVLSLGDKQVETVAQYGESDTSVGEQEAIPAASSNKGKVKATTAPKVAATVKPAVKATTAPKVAATVKPAVKATTAPVKAAATAKPATSTGCSAPMKLLVPLYSYPGSEWDTVIAGEKLVHTVAVINPNNGPGSGPDSAYKTYMTKMDNAGVDMVGYVHTSYGARAIADVKADIAKYASEFPLVMGIFIDEAAATAAQVSYYTQVHQYIMSFPGWKYNILNPGTAPTAAYLSISTQIVSYESNTAGFANSATPNYATCGNKDQFVMITYAASSTTIMQNALLAAKNKGYYGWVFVNSGALSGNTYGTLPSYYAAEAAYLASIN